MCVRCTSFDDMRVSLCTAQRLSEVGTGLRGIGTSMFTGTKELLEHVTEAISSELDSIEGMAARNKPQSTRSTGRYKATLRAHMTAVLLICFITAICRRGLSQKVKVRKQLSDPYLSLYFTWRKVEVDPQNLLASSSRLLLVCTIFDV